MSGRFPKGPEEQADEKSSCRGLLWKLEVEMSWLKEAETMVGEAELGAPWDGVAGGIGMDGEDPKMTEEAAG